MVHVAGIFVWIGSVPNGYSYFLRPVQTVIEQKHFMYFFIHSCLMLKEKKAIGIDPIGCLKKDWRSESAISRRIRLFTKVLKKISS